MPFQISMAPAVEGFEGELPLGCCGCSAASNSMFSGEMPTVISVPGGGDLRGRKAETVGFGFPTLVSTAIIGCMMGGRGRKGEK